MTAGCRHKLGRGQSQHALQMFLRKPQRQVAQMKSRKLPCDHRIIRQGGFQVLTIRALRRLEFGGARAGAQKVRKLALQKL